MPISCCERNRTFLNFFLIGEIYHSHFDYIPLFDSVLSTNFSFSVKDLLPLILPYENWLSYYTYKSDERVLREPTDSLAGETTVAKTHIDIQNYNLIIFDLHGTLVCIDNKYGAWLEKLINRYCFICVPLPSYLPFEYKNSCYGTYTIAAVCWIVLTRFE